MKKIAVASFVFLMLLGFAKSANAQCTGTPITSFTLSGTTNISCFNGSDGQISVTLAGGQSPFTYSLVFATSGGDIPVSQVSNTTSQTATFTGLLANDLLTSFFGPGSYKVTVITTNGNTGGLPPLVFCNSRQITPIVLTQPPDLTLSGSDV